MIQYTKYDTVVRLRLREEVDILKQLTETSEGRRGHPNVLRYIDSWEQDGLLFIQTELCALGSFGRFLWDYGRKFPRLDEARVWKILAELTEVSTLLPLWRCFDDSLTVAYVTLVL